MPTLPGTRIPERIEINGNISTKWVKQNAYGIKYSRMDQLKFMEAAIKKF